MILEGPEPQDSRLKAAEEAVLTPSEYIQQPAAHSERPIYRIALKDGDKAFTYFGASHTNDPGDPIFDEILKSFEAAAPEIVYFEGWEGANRDPERARAYVASQTLEEAKKDSEATYTLKLAVDAGIPFESPEPSDGNLYTHLMEQGFSGREIFLQMFYRTMHQYQREHQDRSLPNCKKYLGPYFDKFRRTSGLPVDELDAFEDEAFADLDLADDEFYRTQCDPIPWKGEENTRSKQLSAVATIYRDQFALRRYAEGLKKHNRLFAVYGRSHAITLEPGLRKLMGA